MNYKRFVMSALLSAFVIAPLGCGQDQPLAEPVIEVTADLPPADGVRMIPVENGRFKVWTRKVGNGDIKVLLLHGGPGGSHDYLVNFADHLVPSGYELYFYDQLGSFRSDKPDDVSLWTVERFLEEVETVRQALGLEDFVLIGHSWGGMLGIEYALKYQEHLKGLVISNMVGSVPLYVEGVNQLRDLMPAEAREILERHEAAKEYANPEYQEILLGQLYSKHVCRLDPWPQAVVDTFDRLNTTIYNHMQGPSEFEVTGTFKDWDRMDGLDKITVPTLLIVGRYDTMRVSDIEEMDRRMPDSSLLICENGSHISNWDDEDTYFGGVLDFLNGLESAAR